VARAAPADAARAAPVQVGRAQAVARAAVLTAPAALPERATAEDGAAGRGPAPAAVIEAPPATATTGFRPRHRRGGLGAVHVGQICLWEAAVAALVAVIGRPLTVLVPVVVAATLIVLITAVRVRRRWLYQWLGLRLRYLVRRRSHLLDPSRSPALVLLDAVAPGAILRTIEVEGDPVGVIEHAGGVTAILEPMPVERGLIVEKPTPLPSPVSLLPLAEADDPTVSTQVLLQVTPAPPLADPTEAPAESYRQLLAGSVPAQRRAWIALQVQRTVDAYSDAELQQALTGAVRRMRRRLGKDGRPVRVLDQDEVIVALTTLAHLDDEPVGGPLTGRSDQIRENWRGWRAGAVPQTCFRVASWPDGDRLERDGRLLLDRLSTVSTLGTTCAVATRRAGDHLEVEAAIRIAAPTAASLERAAVQLETEAKAVGAQLRRLDGEQSLGAAASLPLGGFLP